jgi:carbon-monoxide dehydrogenase small subunit
MSDKVDVTLTINGRDFALHLEPRRTLADAIREDCGQTGTHLGCEHGVCGACTVLLDGQSVRSCLLLAVQVNGRQVTTVEGLARGDELSPLQQAFWENHGLQCGFCTPGMLTTLTEFLAHNPDPTEAQVRDAISGNICRCTGYQSIVASALAAARAIRAAKGKS